MGASVTRDRIDPRRLAVAVTTASGRVIRWGPDESSADRVPKNIRITTKMPGGFGTLDCSLQRVPDVTYADLDRFAPVRCYGAGGFMTAFDGYIATRSMQRGDDVLVSPSAVGWSSALKDNPNFKEIYVDQDKTHWGVPSVQRKINAITGAFGLFDPTVTPDATTGNPSLEQKITGAWTTNPLSEAWYDARNIPLGSLYFAWTRGANVASAGGFWNWQAVLSTDDIITAIDGSGNLQAVGPGTGTLTATTATRKFGLVQLYFNGGASGVANTDYSMYWTALVAYGNHGLTKQGVASATQGQGLLASDIVKNIVNRTTPMLAANLTTSDGLIVPTAFVIPHLVFLDPTTGADAITAANRFHLND